MKFTSVVTILLITGCTLESFGQATTQTFSEIKIYHFDTPQQEQLIDGYLRESFLPALKRYGIGSAGVFKPVGNDTLQDKRIYVLIPFKTVQQYANLPEQLQLDAQHNKEGKAYLEASYKTPPYRRMESIFLKAFAGMPVIQVPTLENPRPKRIYELRSYEGPTERMYSRKVQMFNEGGEIRLFDRLGFNAVFYGSVISGSRMPNLMYMTAFEDMNSRDEHWKAFFAAPEWKEVSGKEYYKNTVSKNEIILLHPADYSGL